MALTNKVSLPSIKATDGPAQFAERASLAQVADQAKPKWNEEQRKQTQDETMALGYMRNS